MNGDWRDKGKEKETDHIGETDKEKGKEVLPDEQRKEGVSKEKEKEKETKEKPKRRQSTRSLTVQKNVEREKRKRVEDEQKQVGPSM